MTRVISRSYKLYALVILRAVISSHTIKIDIFNFVQNISYYQTLFSTLKNKQCGSSFPHQIYYLLLTFTCLRTFWGSNRVKSKNRPRVRKIVKFMKLTNAIFSIFWKHIVQDSLWFWRSCSTMVIELFDKTRVEVSKIM